MPVRQCGEQVDHHGHPAGPQAARPQPGTARPFADLDADLAADGPLGPHDDGPRPRGAGDGVGQSHAATAGQDRGPLELAPPGGPELQHVDGVQGQVVQVADGEGDQVRRRRDAPVLPPLGTAPARYRRAVQGPARPADRRGIDPAVGEAQSDRTGDLTFVRGHARTLCGRERGGRGGVVEGAWTCGGGDRPVVAPACSSRLRSHALLRALRTAAPRSRSFRCRGSRCRSRGASTPRWRPRRRR